MNWWAVVTVLAIIGLASIALAHRPVTVYVWARDVSVCAPVLGPRDSPSLPAKPSE